MIYPSPILWNPINFIDGEGRWLAWEALIIFTALFASKIVGLCVARITKKSASDLSIGIAQSIHRPLFYLIWYLAALYSFDLVTEQLLSYSYPKIWATLYNLGILIAAGWFFLRLKDRAVAHAIARGGAHTGSVYALSKIGTILFVLLALILLNDLTELKMTTLLTFGGIGGLALAFAAQNIVSNFFGGLMVHVTRSFVPGDSISMPAHAIEGTVEEIGWYQTRIQNNQRAAVYIPNALFTSALAINQTRTTHCVFSETFSVEAAPENIATIIKELTSYLSNHPGLNHDYRAGAHIKSLQGPYYSIALYGTFVHSDRECCTLRDGMLIHIAKLISKAGGNLA